jgi:hypothetical protein
MSENSPEIPVAGSEVLANEIWFEVASDALTSRSGIENDIKAIEAGTASDESLLVGLLLVTRLGDLTDRLLSDAGAAISWDHLSTPSQYDVFAACSAVHALLPLDEADRLRLASHRNRTLSSPPRDLPEEDVRAVQEWREWLRASRQNGGHSPHKAHLLRDACMVLASSSRGLDPQTNA